MSNAYAEAIASTRAVLARRAIHYRALVACIGAMTLATLVVGAFLGFGRALVILAFLPCAVLVFVAVDMRTVQRWRRVLIDHWARGDLRLEILISTLLKIPDLPRHTVDGLLSSLPRPPSDGAPLTLRPLLADLQKELASVEFGTAAWRALGVAAAACSLVTAVAVQRPEWLPWAGSPLLVAFGIASAREFLRRRSVCAHHREMAATLGIDAAQSDLFAAAATASHAARESRRERA